LNDKHTCTSSGRRKMTIPIGAWVAARALPLLMKKPHMGAKELQTTLQDTFGCTIAYDTVWHGKEKALKELFESWEESFNYYGVGEKQLCKSHRIVSSSLM
jgi:hypothetical protein